MTTQDTRALRKALEPFALLGQVYTKHGPLDLSPWCDTPDDEAMMLGGGFGWIITVRQLRAAAKAYKDTDDSGYTVDLPAGLIADISPRESLIDIAVAATVRRFSPSTVLTAIICIYVTLLCGALFAAGFALARTIGGK